MKSQAAEHSDANSLPEVIAVTSQGLTDQVNALARARAFAEPLLASEILDTGENTLAHADAVATILKSIGGSEAMQAATYLVYASAYLSKPQEIISKAFGESFSALAIETTKLVQVQRQARAAQVAGLRSPMRIDAIARRQLGLTAPVPGQVAPVQSPGGPILAQVRRNSPPAAQ